MRIAFVLLMIASTSAWAGGSIVGNGAGLVEQNVFFTRASLPRAIEDCLRLASACGLSTKDTILLAKIREIALRYPFSSDRVRFVSEKESPGFFETGAGEAHRIAKTGDEPGDVVYWNVDLFYGARGTPLLGLSALTALWIHELGHQAGEKDHGELDRLGALVRRLQERGSQELAYNEPGAALRVLSLSYSSYTGASEVFLSDGSAAYDLEPALSALLRCREPGASFLGWRASYLRWDERLAELGAGVEGLPMTIWALAYCLRNGVVESERSDLSLRLLFERRDGLLRFLRVERR